MIFESILRRFRREPGVGDAAPDFALKNAEGQTVRLSDFRGKRAVVLYFYPKDGTYGCIAESRSFRDSYSEFLAENAVVIGVSSDSEASHQAFAAKHELPFTLLSDPGGLVRRRYAVRATAGVIPGRTTFVIDEAGAIIQRFSSQFRIDSHVERARSALRGRPR